ncbi:hypothetical protein N499_0610A, partial [Wolbachia pipientis wVitA]
MPHERCLKVKSVLDSVVKLRHRSQWALLH